MIGQPEDKIEFIVLAVTKQDYMKSNQRATVLRKKSCCHHQNEIHQSLELNHPESRCITKELSVLETSQT